MKKVMVRAWEIAKEAVSVFGGKIKEYFSQALAVAWQEEKELNEMYSAKVTIAKIKAWIIKKNLGVDARDIENICANKGIVVSETEKAILVNFLAVSEDGVQTIAKTWIPKSQADIYQIDKNSDSLIEYHYQYAVSEGFATTI